MKECHLHCPCCLLIDLTLVYCVTGSSGGALGAFRRGAVGATGDFGADELETEAGGVAGKPEPFLMRTSPTSVVRLIFDPPDPIWNVTDLLSPSTDGDG